MKRVLCVGVTFLSLAISAFAQSGQPSRDEVLKFLEVMRVRKQMEITLQGMTDQTKAGLIMAVKRQVPEATPEQIQKLASMFDDILATYSIDELVEKIVPVYQKHFTHDDLAAAVQFYSSPAGQLLLDKLPAVTQEAMQAGGEYGQSKMQEIEPKIEARIKEFESSIKAQHKEGSPAPAKPKSKTVKPTQQQS